jgi:hypothetical protein
MKRLLIIAILFASCTADYDDLRPALYDVKITEYKQVTIQAIIGGKIWNKEQTFRVIFDGEADQRTLDELTSSYPEGTLTIHEPLIDGQNMRETIIRTEHEITRK